MPSRFSLRSKLLAIGSVAAVALLAIVAGTSTPAPEPPTLRAGAAVVDVTPKLFPINMPGLFSANPAEKANDPLHVRALVLDDGKMRLALVLVDNLGVGQDTAAAAKALAASRCPIPAERMLISSTHTHSGAPANITDGPAEAVAYHKQLIAGIADAIVQANEKLRPAAVGAASHDLPDEVFNRRWFLRPGKMPLNPFGEIDLVKMNPGLSPDVLLHPAGPTDPAVSILSVQEAKSNRPLALYANYSLHYVGATPRGCISADYYGEFARLMPTRLRANDDFVAMLTNGTSGDINNVPVNLNPPRPPREVFEQIRIVAGKTADAAWQARQKITEHRAEVRLGMLQRPLTLRMRKPTQAQLERAEKILALKDDAEKAKLPRLATNYAERTVALSKGPDTVTVPLQALFVGDQAICAIPFETFAETGLDLKHRSPFPRTMVVGIANGYNGYLPTPVQHKLGGYETWLGTNRVQQDASVLITDTLLGMLKELAR